MYSRNKVFTGACTGLLLFGMTLITLGSVMPAMTEKFQGQLNAAWLVAVLPLGLLCGSLVFGPVADRYGYKLLLAISIVISAISLEGLAFTHAPSIIYACFFGIGFGGGIINGGGSALVADISKNKGASLSLLGVFFGLGSLGMPLLLGVFSKKYAYTDILAAVGLLMMLPVIFLLAISFPPAKQKKPVPFRDTMRLAREPALLVTSFFLFFQSGIEALVSNWTTSFLQFKLDVSEKRALFALSFYMVGLTVARLLLGWWLKNISSFMVLFISLALTLSASITLYIQSDYTIAFIALLVFGFGLSAGFPVILGYIGQLFAERSGTAFSIAFVIALTGNTLINYFFGLFTKQHTAGYFPLLLGLCLICMLVVLVLIKKKIGPRVKG